MPDIFISYSHKDKELVKPIVRELEMLGWSVFWGRKIPRGQAGESSVGKALDESRCVLVFWSEFAVHSDWVKDVAGVAKEKGILVPLFLDAVEAPRGFRQIQAADLSNWHNDPSYPPFQELIGAIESKLDRPVILKPKQEPITEPITEPERKRPRLRPRQRDRQESWFSKKQNQITAALAVVLLVILVVVGFMKSKSEQTQVVMEGFPNFVLIRGGEFTMGSPEGEFGWEEDETQHKVKVSDFYMSKYAVTVAEFRKFVEATRFLTDAEKGDGSDVWNGTRWEKKAGVNWRCGVSGILRPSMEDKHPVVHVSWNDAVAYCKWMSETTGKSCRLPTEAEREYACRAGTNTPFNTGQNLTTGQANYNGNYPYNNNQKGGFLQNTVPVNKFKPNQFGLYNMHGNVWEWCSDWYGANYYEECKAKGLVENPTGPLIGSNLVLRGGSWSNDAQNCRSAYRDGSTPGNRNCNVGFRLVVVP